jgi:hypothetical protein
LKNIENPVGIQGSPPQALVSFKKIYAPFSLLQGKPTLFKIRRYQRPIYVDKLKTWYCPLLKDLLNKLK